MSRDECVIDLEGFEDEKDADINRSIRCAAVTLNQSFGVVSRTRLVAVVVVQYIHSVEKEDVALVVLSRLVSPMI